MSKEQCQMVNKMFNEEGHSPFYISEHENIDILSVYKCLKETNGRTKS